MSIAIKEDPCFDKSAKKIDVHSFSDNISLEDCERLVLSPSPVPLNFEAASAAIYAAARRSRSQSVSGSTRSLKSNKVDTHCDAQTDNSDKSSVFDAEIESRKIQSSPVTTIKRPSTKWLQFFCCLSSFSSDAPKRPVLLREKVKKPSAFIVGTKLRKKQKFYVRSKVNNTNSIQPFVVTNGDHISDLQSVRTTDDFSSVSYVDQVDICTSRNFHPLLPNFVLNALGSHAPNIVNGGCTMSTCNFTETAEPTTVSNSDNCARMFTRSNHFSLELSILPGFKHQNNLIDLTNTKLSNKSLETDDLSNGHNTDSLNVESEESVIHQQVQFNQFRGVLPPWFAGNSSDGDGHLMTTNEIITVDRSGGEGDTSPDNLDSFPPGVDLLGEIAADCVNKKCLVLDLDETLVHSSFKFVDNADFIVPVEINGITQQVYVRKRPHLDKFLKTIGPLFECVMFTASLRKYADPVCDYIDADSHFRHRLFREACVEHQNNLIKDLSRLGRDIDQICIVDNSPISFLFQPTNALQIVSWFGDTCDQALLELIPYLIGLADSDTVVDYLHAFHPPQTAAVAQPHTPSWLFLLNSGIPSEQNAIEDDEVDQDEEEASISYHSEGTVLSPHYR